jgi:hypothetical protein
VPHFFFHITQYGMRAVDEEGADYADLAAARADAAVAGRQLTADEMLKTGRCEGGIIEIADADGTIITEFNFPEPA